MSDYANAVKLPDGWYYSPYRDMLRTPDGWFCGPNHALVPSTIRAALKDYWDKERGLYSVEG